MLFSRRLQLLLLALAFGACLTASSVPGLPSGVEVRELDAPAVDPRAPRILCVVAHPDDEIAFGGTIYKTTTFLHGRVDIAVVTNGEGGYKYSTLAERVYGIPLTREAVGRANLPRIRHGELAAGCRWLGVSTLFFLDEQDQHYTRDEGEMLAPGATVWDIPRVQAALGSILDANHYDFVLVLAPTPGTHGGHKSATILALRTVASREVEDRPVILCGRFGAKSEPLPALDPLPGFPITRTLPAPGLLFDRTQSFGYRGVLNYSIVINWAIAEHKSQGTMQLLMNRGEVERYDLFAINRPGAVEEARALFASLEEPQYETVTPPVEGS